MQRTVLTELLKLPANGETAGQLLRLANRIGENRIVAGLHYKTDIDQGEALGKSLGDYVIDMATNNATSAQALNWLWRQALLET